MLGTLLCPIQVSFQVQVGPKMAIKMDIFWGETHPPQGPRGWDPVQYWPWEDVRLLLTFIPSRMKSGPDRATPPSSAYGKSIGFATKKPAILDVLLLWRSSANFLPCWRATGGVLLSLHHCSLAINGPSCQPRNVYNHT